MRFDKIKFFISLSSNSYSLSAKTHDLGLNCFKVPPELIPMVIGHSTILDHRDSMVENQVPYQAISYPSSKILEDL